MWKSPAVRWAIVLGFALGGFFDGILLHQILQWHHLLSLVADPDDLRFQVLWDGYFHALMYAIAALGLWGLWRPGSRASWGGGRVLPGGLLLGFGLWQAVDIALAHWLLELHHVRLDSASPVLWDLLWLALFGIVPLVAGWLLLRGGRASPGLRGATAHLLVLTAVSLGAGTWALKPPPDQSYTTVVFPENLGPPAVFAALDELDARLVWADRALGVVVVTVEPGKRWDFYAHGALLVSGAGLPAVCADWSRV